MGGLFFSNYCLCVPIGKNSLSRMDSYDQSLSKRFLQKQFNLPKGLFCIKVKESIFFASEFVCGECSPRAKMIVKIVINMFFSGMFVSQSS